MGTGSEKIGAESADVPAPVWTGDPLCALLDELRGEGFPLGIGEYLEAQEAAAACYRDGLGHQPHRLRNYLAPVLCRSFEQQQIFYRRFDTWWVDRAGGKEKELPHQPTPPPPLHQSELGEVARRTRPWKWWAVSAVGAVAIVAALAWWSSLVGSGSPDEPAEGSPTDPEKVPSPGQADGQAGPAPGANGEDAGVEETGRTATSTARRTVLKVQVVDLAGRPIPGAMVRVEQTKGELIATLEEQGKKIYEASFSPDGRQIVTTGGRETQIWDAAKGTLLSGLEGSASTASWSPDGRLLVTASQSYSSTAVWISDSRTGKLLSQTSIDGYSVGLSSRPNFGGAISFSPDGQRVVVTAGSAAQTLNLATGTLRGGQLRHKDLVLAATFGPDGRIVATVSADGTAQIWEAATGKPRGEPLQHKNEVLTASFSPDGRRIVTASIDNTARIWDVASSQPLGEPLRHDRDVLTASFSPDSMRVVTASRDNTARIWSATTGKPLGEPLQHDGAVWAATFSADGGRVLTVSEDGTARSWDAATGKLLGELLRTEGSIIGAAFSQDRFATVSGDKVRIWRSARNLVSPPTREISTEEGVINLILGATEQPKMMYFSHPGYHSPRHFTIPANAVSGTLRVKLAPLTLWERLDQHQRKVQAGLVFLPLVFAGPWLAWRVLRRRQLVLERRTTPEEQAVTSPSLPEPTHELYRGAGFARARVEVQRRQRTGAGDLDPDATIEATVRRRFFTPVYRARLELPVYLVLVDRTGIRDQRARMVDELLDRLQAGGVALVRYDFDRDPRRASLHFSGGAHRDLEELAGQYPGHRLAVFTDVASFTDPAIGQLAPWTQLFSAWPERVLLTPVPPSHWSRRELDLAATGFVVLPASEAGIERLADMLRRAEGAVPRPLEDAWRPPYPELLADRPGRFLERHPPEENELSALCSELAFYLGPDGYRWLCSLAVYPDLDWYFTLYLGLLLRRFDGRTVLDETTLLALTRLPWLRHGSMPDWLRLRLLRDLSEDDEKEVREWMRQFLEQRETPGSRFRLDVARPPEPEARGLRERLRRWTESMDWRRLIKDWAHGEPAEGALRDQIFVSFLLGTKPSRLQVLAPSAWRRLVWDGANPALGPGNRYVLLLTALLSVLGFALGGPDLEWLARNVSSAGPSRVTVAEAVRLRAESTKECLEIRDDDDAKLAMARCGDLARQLWRIEPSQDSGYSRLRSLSGEGRCLIMAGNGSTNDLGLSQCNDSPLQHWNIEPSQEPGKFRLRARFTRDDECLDILGSKGPSFRINPCNGSPGQIWELPRSRPVLVSAPAGSPSPDPAATESFD